MTDINNVTILGRLTRDLDQANQNEFAFTPNGQARANISIAVNRSKKQGDQWVDEVSYFNVTIWGNTANNLKDRLKKGTQIVVSGYLKQDRWKDQQGNNRDRISVVAESVQLVSGQTNVNNQPTNNPGYVASTAQPSWQQPQRTYQQPAQNMQIPPMQDAGFPEDIPF